MSFSEVSGIPPTKEGVSRSAGDERHMDESDLVHESVMKHVPVEGRSSFDDKFVYMVFG